MHSNELDQKKYPYVEIPTQKKDQNKEKKPAKGAETYTTGVGKALLDNPRLFVFVFGGLSHHEMCCMAELQANFPAQIVPGSNEIITANTFLKQLEILHKFDLKKVR